MKKNLFIILSLLCAYSAKAQVNQISIGASNVTLVFNSVKYDSSDGSTINVGYVNDPAAGTGNDCFMVKLDASQQIVWQKSISNSGDDDYFNEVVVCANGDYLAVGRLKEGVILRGIACRINKTNGNIIWASKSANSSSDEAFWSVHETTSGNIAISGTGPTSTFIVLLNSAGGTIWAQESSYASSDGAFAINQLPNGNLIVGAFAWVGYYEAIIMELNESTGAVISENSYTINTPSPNSGLTLNSLWPRSIKIKDGVVIIDVSAFEDASAIIRHMSIYTYDQTTRQLSGNIYYHTGDVNSIGQVYVPLANNDFLIAQSFTNPSRVYVSRVTNNSIIYDRLLNNSVISINGIDTTGTNSVYSGSANYNTYTNTYNLFSPRSVPSTVTSCSITNSNTLALQASTLSATPVSNIGLSASIALNAASLTVQTPAYASNIICGSVLPLTFINFNANYNNLNNSAQLKWSTSNETNSKSFIIERSTDNGVNFISIGSVDAKGSNSSVASYDFIDKSPVNGTNLYRLKEIDEDGSFKYSNVTSVLSRIDKINIYYLTPNPTSNFTLINSTSVTDKLADIQVLDVTGKLVKHEVAKINNAHPHKLLMRNLPGIYYIKIRSENSLTTLKLVVK